MKQALDRKSTRPPERGQRGVVLVEFALILPVLVLLFLGIVDLGLIIREHQVLQNAAREGARFSALPQNRIAGSQNPGATQTAIQQVVVNYAAQENITISAANITINQQYPIPIQANGLTPYGSDVNVTYTRSFLFPGGSVLPFSTVTLTGDSVFRNLY